jgi:hypothetical protein
MANAGVPKGKSNEGKGVDGGDGGAVNTNAMKGGFGSGMTKQDSMNQLTSNAKVVKSATSTLMSGMSSSRGAGGAK